MAQVTLDLDAHRDWIYALARVITYNAGIKRKKLLAYENLPL